MLHQLTPYALVVTPEAIKTSVEYFNKRLEDAKKPNSRLICIWYAEAFQTLDLAVAVMSAFYGLDMKVKTKMTDRAEYAFMSPTGMEMTSVSFSRNSDNSWEFRSGGLGISGLTIMY